jgi:hypothetical protein
MKTIVIFLGESLLAQGIFSYLTVRLQQVKIYALNPSVADAFEQVKKIQPDIVILETKYLWKDPRFPFISLLSMLPHLTILELHPDSPEINIIKSEQLKPANLDEMVSFLNINEAATPKPMMLQAV